MHLQICVVYWNIELEYIFEPISCFYLNLDANLETNRAIGQTAPTAQNRTRATLEPLRNRLRRVQLQPFKNRLRTAYESPGIYKFKNKRTR